MFDELQKYSNNNHFFLKENDNLKDVCNAPSDQSGVYIVYALKKGRVELIYIGRSGKMNADGTMFIRKAGLGGIKDRLVNGHQFGKIARKLSWINQMKKEQIEALDVYWYVTCSNQINDCPKEVESILLKRYFDIYDRLPRLNAKI